MTELAEAVPHSWHALLADEVTLLLGVDAATGLSSAEAAQRMRRDGPNRLAEVPREPRWRAFLRQFADLMIIILLVAAVVSLVVTREWETPVVIAAVVLLNATIGFVQESRAEASLQALAKMLVTTASVRRDGTLRTVDAVDLVVGDVVTLDAGARVPADGRLLAATALEVQESALTGEAQPVAKSAAADVEVGATLGDRASVVFMTTTVTRGHGELVVTATGMRTETGRIAHLLHDAEPDPTPLQVQITGLSRTLAIIAGAVVPIVFALGLLRGQDFGDLFVSAVSLAVAAIPEGLPAVVTFTLAMGAARLAKRGAVVKRLASVETLGSTSQICTDKTGTLTLNQMTARRIVVGGHRFTVSGEGYSTQGEIRSDEDESRSGAPPAEAPLAEALTAMALCTDSELRDGDVVGDPTEGALMVLAAKGGVDVAALRRECPRVAEVPFDTEYKFMATFHRRPAGEDTVRCYVKGAPDVLLGRADRYADDGAGSVPLDAAARDRYKRANAELAGQGMRVLAIGVQDVPAADLAAAADPKDLLDRVELVALVGIVDPPGPEAQLGVASVAGTMAFVTFVFFQVFNLLGVRHDTRSMFSRETLRNTSAFVATASVVVLLVVVVQLDVLQGFFTTTGLTVGQWLVCAAIGSTVLWVGEGVKVVLRRRAQPASVDWAAQRSGPNTS